MAKAPIKIKRKKERFYAESSRVITKFYLPGGNERARHIIDRLLNLPEKERKKIYDQVIADFSSRHKKIERIFNRNFEEVREFVPADVVM